MAAGEKIKTERQGVGKKMNKKGKEKKVIRLKTA